METKYRAVSVSELVTLPQVLSVSGHALREVSAHCGMCLEARCMNMQILYFLNSLGKLCWIYRADNSGILKPVLVLK